jgi:hypothetical protein
VFKGAQLCPCVERRRIDEIYGSPQGTKSSRSTTALDLNYLRNFHIYLTAAQFAGSEYAESQSIGQFADELTSKPALICITRWR